MFSTTYLPETIQNVIIPGEAIVYSKVSLIHESVEVGSAGTDDGRTLKVEVIWGNNELAKSILNMVNGIRYQPYEANGVRLDPAVELGDRVVSDEYIGGVYSLTTVFGPLCTMSIAAPSTDEELDHEYPYTSPQERTLDRQFQQITNELNAQTGSLGDKISSQVSGPQALNWSVNTDSWIIQAGSLGFFRASNQEMTFRGQVEALRGSIADCTIKDGKLLVPSTNLVGQVMATQIDGTGLTGTNVAMQGQFAVNAGNVGPWNVKYVQIKSTDNSTVLFEGLAMQSDPTTTSSGATQTVTLTTQAIYVQSTVDGVTTVSSVNWADLIPTV